MAYLNRPSMAASAALFLQTDGTGGAQVLRGTDEPQMLVNAKPF